MRDIPYCGVSEEEIKNAQPRVSSESMEMFAHWIEERYKIHLLKESGAERPWTEDKVLANYRFTNVRREQDRQTKYLIDNIANNDKLDIRDKVINIILFRYWNLWETMQIFGGPWTRKELMSSTPMKNATKIYTDIMTEHPRHNFFTSAFLTSGAKIGVRKEFGATNAVTGAFLLARYAIKNKIAERVIKAPNQQESCRVFEELPGVGKFLSYQMWVDCTYISEFPFSENDFTVAGPGCRKGLSYLFIDSGGLTPEEAIFWLRDNLATLAPQLKPQDLMVDIPIQNRFISVMSLENCLCEFSKYYRAYKERGRPKLRYVPYRDE